MYMYSIIVVSGTCVLYYGRLVLPSTSNGVMSVDAEDMPIEVCQNLTLVMDTVPFIQKVALR